MNPLDNNQVSDRFSANPDYVTTLTKELKDSAKKSSEAISQKISDQLAAMTLPKAQSWGEQVSRLFRKNNPNLKIYKELNNQVKTLQSKLGKETDIGKINKLSLELKRKIQESQQKLPPEAAGPQEQDKEVNEFIEKADGFKGLYEKRLTDDLEALRHQSSFAIDVFNRRIIVENKCKEIKKPKKNVKIQVKKDIKEIESNIDKIEKLHDKILKLQNENLDPAKVLQNPAKVLQTIKQVKTELDKITKIEDVLSDPKTHSSNAQTKTIKLDAEMTAFFSDDPTDFKNAKKLRFQTEMRKQQQIVTRFHQKYQNAPVTPTPVAIRGKAAWDEWLKEVENQKIDSIPTLQEVTEFLKANAALNQLEQEFTAYKTSIEALKRADGFLKNVKGKKTKRLTKIKREMGYYKLVKERRSILNALNKATSPSDFQKIQQRCLAYQQASQPLYIQDNDVDAVSHIEHTDKLFEDTLNKIYKEGTGAAKDHVRNALLRQAAAIRVESRTDLTAYGNSLTRLQTELEEAQIKYFEESAEAYYDLRSTLSRDSILLQDQRTRLADLTEAGPDATSLKATITILEQNERFATALIQREQQLFDQLGTRLSLNQYFEQVNALTDTFKKSFNEQRPDISREILTQEQADEYAQAAQTYVTNVDAFLSQNP